MPATKTATTRTPDAARCGPLQQAIANRARIVLSLCDQRVDAPLSLPVIAAGMSQYLDRHDYQEHSMVSRLLRARRNWRPEHLHALAQYAGEFGVAIDPGWLTYGAASEAPPPVVPADCVLRPETELGDVPRSRLSLSVLRQRGLVARRRGKRPASEGSR